MRRLVVVSALIAGLMSLSMPTAWASGRDVARVEGLRGDSSVRTSSSANWQALEGDLDLSAGASLRTAAGAEALVSLPGDVVLRVAPGSEVEVSRLEGRNVGLRLQAGRVYASVPVQDEGSARLVVDTPAGTALSSGGEFTLDAGRETSLRVISGTARLSGQQVTCTGASWSSAQAVDVPAGTEAVAQTNTNNDDDTNGADTNEGTGTQGTDTGSGTGGGTGGTGAGGGTGTAGGGFPILAVLGGLGLIALIALLISESSEVQSG